jgi:adenylate kinase family enzyme
MKRIMIVGGPGSGKSTLAGVLGERLGLPVFHMDKIHWKEDWVERPRAEKIPMALAVEAGEAWVFEGGMSSTYESRVAHADVLVWLDLPVGLRLWRVTKRLFRYLGKAEGRPDLPKGCVERIHPETFSFFWFIWKSRNSARIKIAQLVTHAAADLSVVHLQSPRDVRHWFANLPDKG